MLVLFYFIFRVDFAFNHKVEEEDMLNLFKSFGSLGGEGGESGAAPDGKPLMHLEPSKA